MPNSFTNYSREGAEKALEQISIDHLPDDWMGQRNIYRKKTTERLDDIRTSGNIKELQLAEYIAASAPNHCIDGWNFLGKAIISHALGDNDTARHFAYYAELRAVLSLMAAEGIGIFNRTHFQVSLSPARKITVSLSTYSKTTHQAAHQAFEEWIKSPTNNSGTLLQEIIRPDGNKLEQWFAGVSPTAGTTIAWSTQDLLSHWGYDLKTLKDDHTARNESSYRATHINPKKSSNLQETYGLIENIWEMLQPTNGGGFEVDKYLLRRSFKGHFSGRGISLQSREKKIKNIISGLNLDTSMENKYTDLLIDNYNGTDPLLLTEAEKTGSFSDVGYQKQMIARATLLLRLATGASRRLVELSFISKDDIEFWWKPIGINRGLWDDIQTTPLQDMWTDISDALSNIQGAGIGTYSNFADWRKSHSSDILTLSGCERIGFSGICI